MTVLGCVKCGGCRLPPHQVWNCEWLARTQPGLRSSGPQRGTLQVQLPLASEYDLPRLAYFLQELRPWQKTAAELRHPSWNREEIFGLLEAHDVACCIMSGAYLPCLLQTTSPSCTSIGMPQIRGTYTRDRILRTASIGGRIGLGNGRDRIGVSSNNDETIIRPIINLARTLRLSVTCEGLETEEQFTYLKNLGCDLGQGYLMHKPLPAAQITALLSVKGLPAEEDVLLSP